jgi:hypothetical protein
MGMVVDGSKGVSRRVPNAIYLNIFADGTTPAVWLLPGVFCWSFWRRRHEQDTLAFVLALLLTLVFPFSLKMNHRYCLPLTAAFYYLAALGQRDLTDLVPPLLPALTVAAGVVFALSQWWSRNRWPCGARFSTTIGANCGVHPGESAGGRADRAGRARRAAESAES